MIVQQLVAFRSFQIIYLDMHSTSKHLDSRYGICMQLRKLIGILRNAYQKEYKYMAQLWKLTEKIDVQPLT